jgi:hypothetical protein
MYGPNPFAEAIQVAGYIRAHSSKAAQIGLPPSRLR